MIKEGDLVSKLVSQGQFGREMPKGLGIVIDTPKPSRWTYGIYWIEIPETTFMFKMAKIAFEHVEPIVKYEEDKK